MLHIDLQYFEEMPRQGNSLGPSEDLKSGEHRRRSREQVSACGRLELIRLRRLKNLCPVGNARRGSHGIRQIQEGTGLLLLEQDGQRSLGIRQPRPGRNVEQLPATVLLPSISTTPASSGQVQEAGGSSDGANSALVDREAIFPCAVRHAPGVQENQGSEQSGDGSALELASPRPETSEAGRLLDFWEIRRESFDLNQTAQKLVEASWRTSTKGRYNGAWSKWVNWCSSNRVQAASPALSDVCNYLAHLYECGAQYRTINVHRSALSATLKPIEGFCVGQHPIVCRLLKGAFNSRPPRPKLCPSWSVEHVLKTLSKWVPASSLDLKTLTYKTCMLVALASAKRPSSLHLLSVKDGFCELGETKIRFQPIELEKNEGLNHCGQPLVIHGYPHDPRVCPVRYVKAYISRTKPLRSTERLFISLARPHHGVASTTIAHWLEKTIGLSGQSGSGGSTRSVSTTKALTSGASLVAVLEAGDWARVSTFSRFYFKPSKLTFQEKVFN